MSSTAPISVVIPVYNAAWCVNRAIDSVLAQTCQPMEIIVVDDGSDDETAQVLAEYGSSLRMIRQSNGGLSSARNRGIDAASGELIAFLDADDWWLPGKLAAQAALMLERPEIGFCSVATQVVDPQGREVNLWCCPVYERPLLEALFGELALVAGSGSAVVVRRALLQRAGPFDTALASLEDIDMWMRLAAVTDYACVEETLAVILKHPDSMSRNLEVMQQAALRVMQKNRPLLPASLRGRYWRAGIAGLYIDYAKWKYRRGDTSGAIRDSLRALALSPLGRGRFCLGLLKDILLARSV